jgi:DNA-binding transcriptional ArsR family regulator
MHKTLLKILVAATPFIYGITQVYLPIATQPEMVNETRTEINEELLKHGELTISELAERLDTDIFIVWAVVKQQVSRGDLVNCPYSGVAIVPLHCSK